ncbi:FMNH2-utilizing oxygenase [Virgisporangium aliadipatigenens]|uniref:FMNH2-utilizing oxygenase n=1 Tax=Virgisporangium aliadipatigenens TaxID=741659 RepID=A0A8J3YJ96_9ACTN|nr:LLM class flavin-dependent oxidoreductase [Virgisporangium aliadipatigenens]GIJ45153.1 FMNH2-utilizing oxygenase [Virgisporangium aliadipatigenens]
MTRHLHLAVALDGAGWHPAARSPEVLRPGYWRDLVRTAERGLLDFVTFEDTLGPPVAGPPGRLDALLVAARVAPATSRIGLVPVVTVTHTEPFHVSTELATLDHISNGRAGWQVRVSGRPAEAAQFGHRVFPDLDPAHLDDESARFVAELFAEAADHVEVVRRLWDSWEDDAVIRDVATGRFVDREKLHYVDFAGRFFSVKGPSIVPRPPQGQPVVTALAHDQLPLEFAAGSADVVYVTDPSIVEGVRPAKVFLDLVVSFDGAAFDSDAHVFTGTPEELVELLLDEREAGIDGFRLRPAVLPDDLATVVERVVPLLQERGAFRTAYAESTLRERLGLPVAVNRYAGASA